MHDDNHDKGGSASQPDRLATTSIPTGTAQTSRGKSASDYAFGDKGAGEELGLPKDEVRKMRVGGKLEGAYAKIGHRSIIYHRARLHQRFNAAFKPT